MSALRITAYAVLLTLAACTGTSRRDTGPQNAATPPDAMQRVGPPAPAPASVEPEPTSEAVTAPEPAPAIEPGAAEVPVPANPAPATPAVAAERAPRPVRKPVEAPPQRRRRESPAPKSEAKPVPPPAVVASSISGRIELAPGARQAVAAGEVADGLVYFLPKAGNPRPKPGQFTIRTHSKGFSPSLLVVPVGSTVGFPNKDTILHNVFSRTPGSTFDLGIYAPGETRKQVFSKPGLVIVNCNVHHNMRANVVVLATPHYTRPGKDGRFELRQLPQGPGTLVFWHPRSTAQSVAIVAPAARPVSQRLVANKPRLDAPMLLGH